MDIFDFHTDRHVHLIRNEKITQLLPRYSLELVFVFSLFVILFFLIGDKPNTNMIPILALFAAAAFRLMPSVNRIVNNFQKLNEKDLVIICDTGAYGSSLGSNYNVRPKPAEILVKGTKIIVIKKRQKLKDLI